MIEIEIREAYICEINYIVEFQIAMALETEQIELQLQTVKNGVTAVFCDTSKGRYYIAKKGDRPIATMLTTYEWSDWRNGTVIWLQSVYVIPEFRGTGVFRKMYEFIKQKVSDNEHFMGIRLYVDNRNTAAQKVYEALGMDGSHYRYFEWMKTF